LNRLFFMIYVLKLDIFRLLLNRTVFWGAYTLYSQIFEIIELPEPRIYFGSYYNDKIYSYNEAIPSVGHYLDDMHKDEYLKYELLSYTYTIQSDNSIEKFEVKSSRGNAELYERLRKLKDGDKISISDIYVLYPNKMVKQINGRTVTFKKDN